MRSTSFTRRLSRAAHAMLAGAAMTLMSLTAAGAADLAPGVYYPDVRYPPPIYAVCGIPVDRVILFDRYGRPTVPARTPMFYCLTGHTLLPGQVPPPPEYCCR
ncbi:MAG TPA: hypothetical protein VHG92_02565 [Afifellaceae bacterium]|nr:hypothetical protein [Afifellaceae bacterium]